MSSAPVRVATWFVVFLLVVPLTIGSIHVAAGPLIGIDFADIGGGSLPNWNKLNVPPKPTANDLIDESGAKTVVDLSYTGGKPGVAGTPPSIRIIPSHSSNS